MYCPQCGQSYDDSGIFCPFCGTKNPQQAAENVQNIPQQAPEYVFTAQQNSTYAEAPQPVALAGTEKKASGRKRSPIKIIIAIVLVIGLIVGAVFVVPKFTGNGKKSDPQGNVFAKTADSLDDDSTKVPVLEILSALYNTVFNSNSFTLNLNSYGRVVADVKVQFGKDLPGSQFAGELYEDLSFCLYEGNFIAADEWSGVSVDVKNIASDAENLLNGIVSFASMSLREEIDYYSDRGRQDMVYSYNFIYDFLKGKSDDLADIAKDLISVVKNERLDIENLDKLLSETIFEFLNLAKANGNNGDANADSNTNVVMVSSNFFEILHGVGSLQNAFDLIADLIVNAVSENAITINENSDGVYKIDINTIDVVAGICDYLATSEKWRSIFGDALVDSFVAEFSGCKNYSEEKKAEYVVSFYAEVSDNYINSLSAKYDGEKVFSLRVSNINNTRIVESDFAEVKQKYDICRYKDSYQNVDDIMNEIN